MTRDSDLQTLELMIDHYGTDDIFLMISHVLSEKADHIRANYNDEPLAKMWDRRSELACQISMIPKLIDALDLLISQVSNYNDGISESTSSDKNSILSEPMRLLRSLNHNL